MSKASVSTCHRTPEVHALADGELDPRAHAELTAHVARCESCGTELEAVFALEAMVETSGLADSRRPVTTTVPAVPARHRRILLPFALGGLALAAAAAVLLVPRVRAPSGPSEAPVPLALGPTRSFEMRLTHPGADRYRPWERLRGSSVQASAPDLEALARLQRKGDTRGLVTRWLLDGDVGQAKAALARAAADRGLDNERGVVALLERRPEEALTWLDRALEADAAAPQPLWNRSLALRELGLQLAAAQGLSKIASLGEPGWSREARDEAARLGADALARKRHHEEAIEAGVRLVLAQTPPADELVARVPDLLRSFFYEAVRSASQGPQLDALAPTARRLDAVFGGRFGDRVLARYVERARRDLGKRADVAAAYARFAGARWKGIDATEVAALEARIVASGQSDLLIGLLLGTKRDDDRAAEFGRLIARERDAWLDLQALDARLVSSDAEPAHVREAAFRKAIRQAEQRQSGYWRVRLQTGLVDLLIRQGRLREAWPLALDLRAATRAQGDYPREASAIRQLTRMAHLRGASALLQGWTEELTLTEDGCANRRVAGQLLAEDALASQRFERALHLANATPECRDGRPSGLAGLAALAELALRFGDRPGQLDARAAFTRAFDQALPGLTGGLRLHAQTMDQRLRLASGRDTDDARARLGETLRGVPADDSDPAALRARRLAAQALLLDAATAGRHDEVLRLTAAERGMQLPATGCVLALGTEREQLIAAARGVSGALGSWIRPMPPATAPLASALPAAALQALDACPEVAILAMAPFHGRPGLLPPGFAWRFVDRSPSAPPPLGRARLLVADVTPPPSLALPTLAPHGGPSSPTSVTLRGAAATPTALLRALPDADVVEVHAHGLVDTELSDAALLVLSPDPDGVYALTAAQVRQRTLPRQPLVVLGACDSASGASYADDLSWRSAAWSLPAGFLAAGARGVLAATHEIPDRPSAAFFADVLARVSGGAHPALALRDARVAALAQGQSWVESIVLFQ